MSNPFSDSKRTTSIKVKSSNLHHDSVFPLPSPQTCFKPITPGLSSPFDKTTENTTRIEYVRRATTSSANSPLLSERESIFATTYLPSDGNDHTPRLAAAEGADDVANLPQDLITDMEFALPSSPPRSSSSLNTLLSSGKLRPSQIVKNVGQKKLPQLFAPSTKLVEESRGTIQTLRRVASEGQSGKHILQLRVTDQNRPSSAENSEHAVSKMSSEGNDGDVRPGPDSENTQPQEERGSVVKETVRQTGSKERSSSRSRPHVEKSIEATLPNWEPAKNVRTRKSSHLMGIFKETTSSETKKRDGQPRAARNWHDEGGVNRVPLDSAGIPQLRSQSAFRSPSASLLEEVPRRTTGIKASDRPVSVHFGDLPIHAEPSNSAALSETSNSSLSMPVSPSKPEHDPYFRKRDGIKRSLSGKRPDIPAKLLEDIRQHHNLTAKGDRGASVSYPLSTLVDLNESERPRSREIAQKEDAEDREEDEEHISSAVYFPHPGPSDEDIEQFASPDEEQKVEPFPALPTSPTSTPKAELKRILSDIAPPEHIDISVKSKHEKSVFHGDYLPVGELVDEDLERKTPSDTGNTAIESAFSASESEASSSDELSDLSQAEGGEVTPTSTPVPQSLLQRRKRTLTNAAPKGAVVLEPYTHQVGGHSTMFRFSRRAVCKQLNNRENEFYERIEQRHPDMLRFLPRWVYRVHCFSIYYS